MDDELTSLFGINKEHCKSVDVLPCSGPVGIIVNWFRLKPGECFRNAHIVATDLDATIVYGFAVSPVAGCPVPAEHCWIKLDGKYYDPSYELIEIDVTKVAYYSLFELDVDFIQQQVDQLDNGDAVDFSYFRRDEGFYHYFKSSGNTTTTKDNHDY